MGERTITADFVNPPIPTREFDWCACYEGDEETGRYGWGPTREKAIADLVENHGDGETVSMASVCYRQGRLTAEDYDEAMDALKFAKAQLEGRWNGSDCAVCEDGDHTSETCHHNPLVLARRWARASKLHVCWHCGYIAYNDAEAKAHFGSSEDEVARCLVLKAPEMWKMVPAYPTNTWIMEMDKLLITKYRESPGGQLIAESISIMLATAPAPPDEPLGENETASTPRAMP